MSDGKKSRILPTTRQTRSQTKKQSEELVKETQQKPFEEGYYREQELSEDSDETDLDGLLTTGSPANVPSNPSLLQSALPTSSQDTLGTFANLQLNSQLPSGTHTATQTAVQALSNLQLNSQPIDPATGNLQQDGAPSVGSRHTLNDAVVQAPLSDPESSDSDAEEIDRTITLIIGRLNQEHTPLSSSRNETSRLLDPIQPLSSLESRPQESTTYRRQDEPKHRNGDETLDSSSDDHSSVDERINAILTPLNPFRSIEDASSSAESTGDDDIDTVVHSIISNLDHANGASSTLISHQSNTNTANFQSGSAAAIPPDYGPEAEDPSHYSILSSVDDVLVEEPSHITISNTTLENEQTHFTISDTTIDATSVIYSDDSPETRETTQPALGPSSPALFDESLQEIFFDGVLSHDEHQILGAVPSNQVEYNFNFDDRPLDFDDIPPHHEDALEPDNTIEDELIARFLEFTTASNAEEAREYLRQHGSQVEAAVAAHNQDYEFLREQTPVQPHGSDAEEFSDDTLGFIFEQMGQTKRRCDNQEISGQATRSHTGREGVGLDEPEALTSPEMRNGPAAQETYWWHRER